ncbi:MAG: 16S rRNA (cytosine(967)-C(5))-methyltransferase RsmB [Lachnospiraceae bacterium]|jgi:16S rRNA (cytosine967-C5)-methyltransferase|nr:16S rRNA (cytosine(967)-C(5))-methyltransferase RsmB [Lachnospiraceae bacterium]
MTYQRSKRELRDIILDMMIRINDGGEFCHLVLREVLAQLSQTDSSVTTHEKALIKRIVNGTLERQLQIDYFIDGIANTPVSKMRSTIANLMRISVYQILFLDGVPDHAVCDEAVKIAKRRGFSSLSGFVNAVLRTISKEKSQLPYPDENDDSIKGLSLRFAMPEWIVGKWCAEMPDERVKILLSALLKEMPLTLRLCANLNKDEKAAWLRAVNDSGSDIQPHSILDYVYQLRKVDDITTLPGYKEGVFAIQDFGSVLVCEAAGIKEDDVVIDVCAAPGGKSLHAAEKAKLVIARDINKQKCRLMSENAARLGRSNLDIVVHDACIFEPSLVNKGDVLFVDLPCSGLGVIARKPDIKHKLTLAALADIENLQRQILATVWQYVKPGGIMIYSTCTISKGENEEMMDWFTANFPFTQDSFPSDSPLSYIAKLTDSKVAGECQLLPGIHESDGFYIRRLRRMG